MSRAYVALLGCVKLEPMSEDEAKLPRESEAVAAPIRPATLEDVARLAGVSVMTASRAINNAPYVSAKSLERVRDAQEQLQYVPHQAARQLATSKTESVALIAPMGNRQFFNDPNVGALFAGASDALTAAGLQLIVLVADSPENCARASRYVRARHVDGAILLSPELLGNLVDELQKSGIPIAGTGSADAVSPIGGVVIDTRAAVASVVATVIAAGAKRPALIAGPRGNPVTELQVAGYRDATNAEELRHDTIAFGDYTAMSGEVAARTLLAEHPEVDAIVAVSDVVASGAIRVAAEIGRRVPHDLQVAGFDDSAVAELTNPKLTTVHVPFYEIGFEVAQRLLKSLHGETISHLSVMPTYVVQRESTN